MRPSLLSGAVLLACAFSVFSRPLSIGQTIKASNQNPPLLISRDWTNSALAFLPSQNLLPNTSPDTPSSGPQSFTGVNNDFSTNELGSGNNPYQLGFGITPPNQLGSGITPPNQLGSGGDTLLGTGSPLEIAFTIPVADIISRLQQLKVKPARYCFYTLLADNSGVEFNECGGDMKTPWDVFAAQFPSFRSGFALYLGVEDNLVSMMNLINECAQGTAETNRGYCKTSEKALRASERQWIDTVKKVYPNVITTQPVRSSSDLEDIWNDPVLSFPQY